MCCFFTALLVLGPRVAVLFWWLARPVYIEAGVDGNWIFAILGWLFVPWTLLMYLIVYPGGVVGFDWVMLGLGFLVDISSYAGSVYGQTQGHYEQYYRR
jgi:hypothetical protein